MSYTASLVAVETARPDCLVLLGVLRLRVTRINSESSRRLHVQGSRRHEMTECEQFIESGESLASQHPDENIV